MSDNPVRRVTLRDLPELCDWAIPRFRERHPRITIGGMWPMLTTAIANPDCCHFVMTDNAVGLFATEIAPYEPMTVVCDVFVTGRDAGCAFEVTRIYKEGMAWAYELGAIEYRFGSDTTTDLSAIAERVGFDRVCTNYVKVLR